jgi:hypothetical protein
MAHYTIEKVLYFAGSKSANGGIGLHLGPKDKKGTTLANLVKMSVAAGQLALNKNRSDTENRYYKITPQGTINLRLLQAKYAMTNLAKNENLNKITSLKIEISQLVADHVEPDFLKEIESLLTLAKTSELDISEFKGTLPITFINRLNMVEPVKSGKPMRKLSITGEVFLDALHNPPIKQSIPTAAKNMECVKADVAVEPKTPVRQATTLKHLFGKDDVFEFDKDAPPIVGENQVAFQNLINSKLVTEVVKDDAYTYYKLEPIGRMMIKSLDHMNSMLRETPSTKQVGNLLIDAPITFDVKMGLSEYLTAGDKLALKYLTKDAYDGLNELHWDCSFNNSMPLYHSVKELIDFQTELAKNSPCAIRKRHQAIFSILSDITEETDNSSDNKGQIKSLLSERVSEKMGLNLDSGQLEHYYVSDRKNLKELMC